MKKSGRNALGKYVTHKEADTQMNTDLDLIPTIFLSISAVSFCVLIYLIRKFTKL